MAPISMILSDLKDFFICSEPFSLHTSENIAYVSKDMLTQKSKNIRSYNINVVSVLIYKW